MNAEKLKRAVTERALAEGFAVMRVAGADAIPQAPERLEAWLAHGYQGEMGWMEERQAQRADPRQLWSEVRSVVMLGMNYAGEGDPLAMLARPDKAAISLYARRRDYHDVIKGKLKSVAALLAARGGADVKVFVDTAPVMEKPLASQASRRSGACGIASAAATRITAKPSLSARSATARLSFSPLRNPDCRNGRWEPCRARGR